MINIYILLSNQIWEFYIVYSSISFLRLKYSAKNFKFRKSSIGKNILAEYIYIFPEHFLVDRFLSLVVKISLRTSINIIQLLSINQLIAQINNWSFFPYFLMKLGSFLEESSEKSDLFLTRCSMNHMSTVMRSNGKLSMMSTSTSEIRSKLNLSHNIN